MRSFKFSLGLPMLVIALMLAASIAAIGQSSKPTIIYQDDKGPMPVAGYNGLYCAGYIQSSAISTGNRIVGGNTEADRYNFTQHDLVYINMGADKGVSVGDIFSVVRPRGQVESRWTKKDVGFFVQEVGALEVTVVKSNISVARVKTSCDSFLLGDLVQLTEKRTAPLASARPALDLFGDPSGKATGRILMARDSNEMLSRNSIAYVDLGADDNVQVGDRLTLFRPLGKGNLTQMPQKESVSERDEGFQSDRYRGGKFSNQGARKDGEKAQGKMITTNQAKEGRPALRKVVGEAVIVNVKERTATVIITRNVQEIQTGDWVEVQ